MVHTLTARIAFCAVMVLTCLICTGCRSAGSPSGVAGLVESVPPQWEPPVETLSPGESDEPGMPE